MYLDRQCEAMDIYVIALFAAEVIQGLGRGISMKWVIDGEVNTGTFCTAQGIMIQLGSLSVALATLAITVQTFTTMWWLIAPKKTIALASVCVQWMFIILWTAIGFGVHTRPPSKYYATPVPYWCWLGHNFNKERIAALYVWLWLTLGVSIALYLPLFLLHRGVIVPGTAWYAPSSPVSKKSVEYDEPGPHQVESRALSRTPPGLWTAIVYPIVYCLVIVPFSVVRWISFIVGESHISPTATLITAVVFSLSGVLNTVMYLLTRAWFFRPKREVEPQAPGDQVGDMT